ncbi:MAG TPA: serine/threonine-protein kinase [Phycisphaerales bacterium]|nr:serine/threonine-protein kinase [Phycisphaerales bacterium]HMP38485.1 serine/threonine-protein kinase [Phycisphaerales bacterium]
MISTDDTIESFAAARELCEALEPLPERERARRLASEASVNPRLAATVRRMLALLRSPDEERPSALDAPLCSLDALLERARREAASDEDPTRDRPRSAAVAEEERALPEIGPRYRLIRRLGRGAVGDVFLAEQLDPVQRRVAVKIIRTSDREPLSSARFRREMESLSRAACNGVVQILDGGVLADGRCYLVTEFVDGLPIAEAADRLDLDVFRRIELVVQLCGIVEHAHRRGVIHRDLKPANVLVEPGPASKGGPAGAPKVTVIDFGIARLINRAQVVEPSLTADGDMLGTLGFMAPEQIAGKAADTRSDVYALGAILFLLLAGGRLAIGRTLGGTGHAGPVGLAELGMLDDAPPIGRRRRELDAVIERAAAIDPEARYPSAGAFAEDLLRFLRRQPVMARPHSLLERLWLASTRSPLVAALLAALALAVVLGLGSAAWMGAQLARERDAQRAEYTFLLDEVLDRIYPLFHSEQTRSELSAAMTASVDRLLAVAPDDAALRAIRARLNQQLGNVAFESGDIERARRHREAALAAFEELSQREPQNLDLLRRHADAVVRLADIAHHCGDHDGARAEYRRAFAILSFAAERSPLDIGLLDDLTWAYDRIWDDRDARERPDDLIALLGERATVAERLRSLDPARPLTAYTIMEGHRRAAIAFEQMGRPAAALAEAETAIALGEALLRGDRERVHYAITLADALIGGSKVAAMAEDPRHERWSRRAEELARGLLAKAGDRTEVLLVALVERRQSADHALRRGDRARMLALLAEIEALLGTIEAHEGPDAATVVDTKAWLKAARAAL